MSFERLPQELKVDIISHMSAHDLTLFARVSKTFNQFVQPRLWDTIDLHHSSLHNPERICPGHSSIFGQAHRRLGTLKAESFLKLFRPLSFGGPDQNPGQLKELALRVRSLSLVLMGDLRRKQTAWHALVHFTNLEFLELHGAHTWLGWDAFTHHDECDLLEQFDLPRAGSSNLRHVKLYGYIPHFFAAWTLKAGVNLERLELGMLKGGIDVQEPDGGRPSSRGPWTQYDFYPANRMRERRQHWWQIPQPLSSFLPSEVLDEGESQKLKLSLPRLKHLHLCQPCRGDNAIAADNLYYWASHVEKAAHKSWRQILVASRLTLETLVLEQRIGVEEFMLDKHPELFEQPDPTGIGSTELLHMIGELLTKHYEFPALKHVILRGIFVSSDDRGCPVPGSPIGDFMVLMQKIGVKCEARRGRMGGFNCDYGGTNWDAWKTALKNEEKKRVEERGKVPIIELDSEELLASI